MTEGTIILPPSGVPDTLYDAEGRRFSPTLLRRAMVLRGLEVDDVARRARLGRSTVKEALRGTRIRDRSAIRILQALAAITPLEVAV